MPPYLFFFMWDITFITIDKQSKSNVVSMGSHEKRFFCAVIVTMVPFLWGKGIIQDFLWNRYPFISQNPLHPPLGENIFPHPPCSMATLTLRTPKMTPRFPSIIQAWFQIINCIESR